MKSFRKIAERAEEYGEFLLYPSSTQLIRLIGNYNFWISV